MPGVLCGWPNRLEQAPVGRPRDLVSRWRVAEMYARIAQQSYYNRVTWSEVRFSWLPLSILQAFDE